MKKIMLLGSGELGKEVIISLQRYGMFTIACDNYINAPAMQVSDAFEVFDMLDSKSLDAAIVKHKPDIIVPEVESIRTDRLYDYEAEGFHVVPSARAANYTMNRKLIRDLAAKELDIKTAPYEYASSRIAFELAIEKIGLPCIVKPLMSSSGKGQSILKSMDEVSHAWDYAMNGSRGDLKEVIVEGFIEFHTEITLLTVTQSSGTTLFCAPIGHRQERGDYQESWQPSIISENDLIDAQEIAKKITESLGGAGIWGIEFFLTADGVVFSELSPRPHDTGMVTLAGTQNLNQFELHTRAFLGYPIPNVISKRSGVSSVLLALDDGNIEPKYIGIEEALKEENTELRIFGKPSTREFRRMGVVLVDDILGSDMDLLRKKANDTVASIKVLSRSKI
ncbi:MAG: Formate-dependent phosphoribosylglycinamide formyltransferase [Owenweeksia sp. TMED14]|nr:MAG: Formate-dependent phosphoribosylglycinamide formyltransferase [Owenweeksia sp. TMED14]|tara:strand:+ start:4915 stop:6093 length:1179 start_codon:yes stop_codon:yes gene_type:complete